MKKLASLLTNLCQTMDNSNKKKDGANTNSKEHKTIIIVFNADIYTHLRNLQRQEIDPPPFDSEFLPLRHSQVRFLLTLNKLCVLQTINKTKTFLVTGMAIVSIYSTRSKFYVLHYPNFSVKIVKCYVYNLETLVYKVTTHRRSRKGEAGYPPIEMKPLIKTMTTNLLFLKFL